MAFLFKFVAALLVTADAGAAFAVSNTPVQNFSVVSPPFTAGISDTFAQTPAAPGGFNFYDDFLFTLPADSDGSLTASAVSVNLSNLLGIDDLQARIYQISSVADLTTGAPGALLADAWSQKLSYNGFTATVLSFQNPVPLPPGQMYAFEVRGNVVGIAGGSYGGNLNISAVPDSPGWVLAMAGVGLCAIRARKQSA